MVLIVAKHLNMVSEKWMTLLWSSNYRFHSMGCAREISYGNVRVGEKY